MWTTVNSPQQRHHHGIGFATTESQGTFVSILHAASMLAEFDLHGKLMAVTLQVAHTWAHV